MEMQGLKPSVLMGKLKQHLPLGVSPDNDLFLAMFFICLRPSMRETVGACSNVTTWAHGCLACLWGKIHRHTVLVPLPIPIPQRRFSHLHVDLVGPLQYSNNCNYIFTIIDRTSKWMEAIPLSETSAAACAKALTFTWISTRNDHF